MGLFFNRIEKRIAVLDSQDTEPLQAGRGDIDGRGEGGLPLKRYEHEPKRKSFVATTLIDWIP